MRRRRRPAFWGHRRGDYTPQPEPPVITFGDFVDALKIAADFQRSMDDIRRCVLLPPGATAGLVQRVRELVR